MGKLGVIGLSAAVGMVAALLPVREAAAQDFGQSWIDRITHQLEQDRGPLTPKAFHWNASAGLQYAFDNNVYLTENDKTSDSIVIPFVQANFSYTESRFELEADLLANYKFYTKEDADDDEERVFVRARQTSSRWNFEITSLFENVSDPSGVIFLDRVSRVVSTTTPKAAFDVAKNWTLEVGGTIQLVRFQDQPYSSGQENNNFSVDGGLVYHTPWAFDLVGQFGYWNIEYLLDQDLGGTPDVFGYAYRVGFRGQVTETISLEALVGYTTVESDYFISSGNDFSEGTMTANINLRWEATSTINFFLDYNRQYVFQGFGDPYQLINTVVVSGKFELTEALTMTGRAQFDQSDTALEVERKYYSLNASLNYKFSPHWVLDGGVTYRGGSTENTLGEIKFTDLVVYVGLGFTW